MKKPHTINKGSSQDNREFTVSLYHQASNYFILAFTLMMLAFVVEIFTGGILSKLTAAAAALVFAVAAHTYIQAQRIKD